MGRIIDLTGQRFGKLVVKELDTSFELKPGRHAKWICQCDCGATKSIQSNHLRDGSATACCYACKSRIEKGTKYGKLTVIEMTDKRAKNGGSVIYKCKCDCGRECEISSTELRANRKTCCSYCSSSTGENIIENLLKQNNIEYIKEYVFPLEKSERNGIFRFDFYIVEDNYIIEFDGEQHFKPVDWFGGQDSFEMIKQRDFEKNELCKKYNIPLIRIPYTQIKKGITLQDIGLNSKFLLK